MQQVETMINFQLVTHSMSGKLKLSVEERRRQSVKQMFVQEVEPRGASHSFLAHGYE